MSWYDPLLAWAVSKLPRAQAPALTQSVTQGAPSLLTVGAVRAALAGLPALGIALSDIVHGAATLNDVEVLSEDALSVASLADPALAPVLSVAASLIPVAFPLIASGGIKGDPNPIADAQTTRNFNPGDPAARL